MALSSVARRSTRRRRRSSTPSRCSRRSRSHSTVIHRSTTLSRGYSRRVGGHDLVYGVDIEAGLVAPVLADVGSLSIVEIHRWRTTLVDRVLAGRFLRTLAGLIEEPTELFEG